MAVDKVGDKRRSERARAKELGRFGVRSGLKGEEGGRQEGAVRPP